MIEKLNNINPSTKLEIENVANFIQPISNNENNKKVQQTNTFIGLQIGVVTQIEENPNNLLRVKVRIPALSETEEGIWARLATLSASKNMGSYFIPNIDDEVIVGFLGNDPDKPIILGSMFGSFNQMDHISMANRYMGFISKEKLKLMFDNEKKMINIETPAGNSIIISEEDEEIKIEDQNSNQIVLNNDGIIINSTKGLNIMSNNDISIKSKGNIYFEGKQISINSNEIMELKGTIIKLN